MPLSLDVNGDGRDDVFVYGPGTIADWIWYSGASGLPKRPLFTTINGTYRPVVGDFDGDGHDDIFWYGPARPPITSGSTSRTTSRRPGLAAAERWEIPLGNSAASAAHRGQDRRRMRSLIRRLTA